MNLLRQSLLAALIMTCFFSACTKQEINSDNKDKSSDNTAMNKVDEGGSPSTKEGIIYVHEAALYIENTEGKMKWVDKAALGDKAMYLEETKEAQRTDGQKRTFYRISLNNKEYWIQDYCYQPDTVPAFIATKDAVLYNSPSLTAATEEIIPQYLIIAVPRSELNSESDTSKSSPFIAFSTYSSEFISSWLVKNKYVKRNAVELYDQNSIQAMMIAQIAMSQKNDTIRNELFQNAIEMGGTYADAIAELQTLAETLIKEDVFMSSITKDQIKKIDETIILPHDTYLLSIPQSRARDLHMLQAGTTVNASKNVVLKNDEGEDEDWYYVQSKQKKGWVQLAFLKKEAEPAMTLPIEENNE